MDKSEFLQPVTAGTESLHVFDIHQLEEKGLAAVGRLPFSIRILVENLMRKFDGRVVTEQDLHNIANWQKSYEQPVEIPYHPARVLMQDFTGVPAVVDLAAMRDAVKDQGGDPKKINPLVPVDLVVDHSVQVDYFGTADAFRKNVAKEYERNGERYALLKWAQKSFKNFSVVPPNSGICHQVNLEHLGRVIITDQLDGHQVGFPDTLVGTDSHTPMINGIGVMGWGVGGIEAEAVMLGQPYYMSIPQVVGVKFVGELKEGITATDLVLTVTEMLRKHNVVEKFVEYFGPGVKALSVTDRATISNMTPEYGATLGFFPVDEKTIEYIKITNRGDRAEVIEACSRALGLFYTGTETPEYSEVLELDLASVSPSLAGPARPQDRIELSEMAKNFNEAMGCEYKRDTDTAHISKFHDESGSITSRTDECVPGSRKTAFLKYSNDHEFGDGSLVIAAITSCTNTSNPAVMLGAGLVAKKAVEKGLRVPRYVKTSLAPGSKVVLNYLEDAGLLPYLQALGFHVAGFGCTTCIGNSGPLPPEIEVAIAENDLNVAAVLSGNRNFEARIHQSIKSNYLASPMLVVVFALAGRIDIDLSRDPVTYDPNGAPVYLKDLWPSKAQIQDLVAKHVKQEFYATEYGQIFEGDEFWQSLSIKESTNYQWQSESTYIRRPPYFEGFSLDLTPPEDVKGARTLLLLGDTVTTDHISPAGAIPEEYPAGQYLVSQKVSPSDFNSYGSRRGNHEVMMRGTFGNIRIKNQLVQGKEGSYTVSFPGGEQNFIYDAAMAYQQTQTPLVVLAGKEYGTGSSRDWAAKGTDLLGIKAVIAESYERIHRSNLVGMGVLPLMFTNGHGWQKLGLEGSETVNIEGIQDMQPRKMLKATAIKSDGEQVSFDVMARLDTDVEVDYFLHGGILPFVIRKILKEN